MSAFKDWLNGLTSKSTPVDADELYIRDSSGTPGSKKLTWGNLKATLLAYFDTAYLKLTGGTLAGGTVTASAPVLTTTQTWNNAGVTFVGKSNAFTDTASASGSLLENWTVGGNTVLSIGKKDSNTSPKLSIPRDDGGEGCYVTTSSSANRGLWLTGVMNLFVGGSLNNPDGGAILTLSGPKLRGDSGLVQWSTGTNPTSTAGLVLRKDADAILAQRNGTNAQTYRNYGTYTDASNYRRVALAMTTAGVATLAPEGAGTGASGNVLHISGLPTSNPGAGILWNDTGTVKVGT